MAQQLKREFKFDGRVLSDPNPDFTNEQVIQFYSAQFPSIVSAIPKQEVIGDTMTIILDPKIGTKG